MKNTRLVLIVIIAVICVIINSASLLLIMSHAGDSFFFKLFSLVILILLPIIIFLGFVLFYENETMLQLEYEKNMLEYTQTRQKTYYEALLKKDADTKAFRNEIFGSMKDLRQSMVSKDYEAVSKKLTMINDSITTLSTQNVTGNSLIDAILSDISSKYPDVSVTWEGHCPPNLSISNTDISTIFSNALSNAFEGASHTPTPYVYVYMKTSELSHTLFVSVENPYAPDTTESDSLGNPTLVSKKSDPGHGYGTNNLRRSIRKNAGVVKFETIKKDDKDIFRLSFAIRYSKEV